MTAAAVRLSSPEKCIMLAETVCGKSDVRPLSSKIAVSSGTVIVAEKSSLLHVRHGFRGCKAHLPDQFGLRFSRKECTPSRKSAVARMRAFSLTAATICRSNSAEE